ncbi:hypothetical protein JJB98_08170 [Bradyrhizobium diazoefficiens]|nr:hypothetical protein [Bradyrhizobium diazoefficiens]QQO19883.1 hypothetical protein JJB98_08170 [Bradyrhizobium diazoefficiens]
MDLTSPERGPLGPLVVLVAAAAGALLALYYYLVPLTGVTGTPGALLVIGSSLALVIDALVLWFSGRRLLFGVFWTLGLLGALCTLTAACFLHAWWLSAAMMVVLVGLVVTLAAPLRQRRAAA